MGKARRCLDMFERDAEAAGSSTASIDIGDIAVGTALGWLDFRDRNENWRQGRPALAKWFGELSKRSSMKQTEPANPPA